MKPGTRILVVEDDRAIARFVRLELEHRNFSIKCAYDGVSGLEEVSEYRPELVVLDIMVPKMDGVALLNRIRQSGNRIPVIMLTARDTTLDKVHSLDHGADFSRTESGAGLGLSIARQIAESHGGEIRVRSFPGEGSTFTLLLPKGAVS